MQLSAIKRPLICSILLIALAMIAYPLFADTGGGGLTVAPTGAAGGDLSGTYPHPEVGGILNMAIAPTPTASPAAGSLIVNQGNGTWAVVPVASATQSAVACFDSNDKLGTCASAISIGNGGTGQTTGATSMWSGISATITSSSTDYIAFGENPGVSVISTQLDAQNIAPFAGTASNLHCAWKTAAEAGGVAFTVEKNGVATALTFTATSGTTGNDTTHNFTFAAGDLLDVKVVNSNATNATGIVSCGFQLNG